MIRAGVGLGRGFQTGAATAEAATLAMRAAGTSSADLVVVFATADHFDDEHALLGPLAASTRGRAIVGCSASGVIVGTEEVERESAVAVLVVDGIGATSIATAPDLESISLTRRSSRRRKVAACNSLRAAWRSNSNPKVCALALIRAKWRSSS